MNPFIGFMDKSAQEFNLTDQFKNKYEHGDLQYRNADIKYSTVNR